MLDDSLNLINFLILLVLTEFYFYILKCFRMRGIEDLRVGRGSEI